MTITRTPPLNIGLAAVFHSRLIGAREVTCLVLFAFVTTFRLASVIELSLQVQITFRAAKSTFYNLFLN
jgi:hypothetical protein